MSRKKFAAKYLQSYSRRTVFFAVVSLIANLAFAIVNGVSAVMYSSLWYGALAGYYAVLILFRGGVVLAWFICLKVCRTECSRERFCVKIYLVGGVFLVVLEIAMAVAITQMVMSSKPVPSGQIMAIANAAYTFYTLTMALINIVKAKRTNDYVIQTLRNVNLVAACMAMLSLTVTLISTFGDGAAMLKMKASVGIAVCAVTLALATFMIIKASKILKYREVATDEQRQQ